MEFFKTMHNVNISFLNKCYTVREKKIGIDAVCIKKYSYLKLENIYSWLSVLLILICIGLNLRKLQQSQWAWTCIKSGIKLGWATALPCEIFMLQWLQLILIPVTMWQFAKIMNWLFYVHIYFKPHLWQRTIKIRDD